MASQSVPQGRSQDQGKDRWEMLQSEENSTCKGPAAGACAERNLVQLGWRGMEGGGVRRASRAEDQGVHVRDLALSEVGR